MNKRSLWAAILLLSCAALVIGCGDYFRPTINFLPSPQGNPVPQGQALILATNPSGNGSNTHINVGGDSNAAVVNVGPNPVFLGKGGGRAFVLNSDSTVTVYTALLPTLSAVTQVIMPAGVSGAIGGGASSNNNIYIADSGSNDVSVIPAAQSVVSQVVPVGSRPVMVAAGAAGNNVYVINHDDNTVTVIGTQDNSVITTIPVGAQPIWGVMSNDGLDVFIVNQGDGTLSVIDTTLNIVLCPTGVAQPCMSTINLNNSAPSAALDSNYAFYDNVRKRVYVTNPGDHSVTVIKADSINLGVTPQILPTFLAKITLSGSPLTVGAIADGTRAYAALANCVAGTNHTNLVNNLASCSGNQVSVIDVVGLVESKLITVGSGPVWLDTSTDGSRVYTANAHDGNISIIKTSTDTEVIRMPAPPQSVGCPNPNCNAPGNQTPFMVQTFP